MTNTQLLKIFTSALLRELDNSIEAYSITLGEPEYNNYFELYCYTATVIIPDQQPLVLKHYPAKATIEGNKI